MPSNGYSAGWQKTHREDQRGGGWEKTITSGDGGRASIFSRNEPGSLSGAQRLPGSGKAPNLSEGQRLPGSGKAPNLSEGQRLPWTEGTRPEWGPAMYNPKTGGQVPWSESQQKGWEGLVERAFTAKEQRAQADLMTAETGKGRLAFEQAAHKDTFGLDQKKWESEEKKEQAARNMEMITSALSPAFGGERVQKVMSSPEGQVGLQNILKSVTDLAKNPDVTIEEAMPKIAAFAGAFNNLFNQEGEEVSPARQWEDMKPFWETIKESGYAEPRVIQSLIETMEKDALKKEAEWLQESAVARNAARGMRPGQISGSRGRQPARSDDRAFGDPPAGEAGWAPPSTSPLMQGLHDWGALGRVAGEGILNVAKAPWEVGKWLLGKRPASDKKYEEWKRQ